MVWRVDYRGFWRQIFEVESLDCVKSRLPWVFERIFGVKSDLVGVVSQLLWVFRMNFQDKEFRWCPEPITVGLLLLRTDRWICSNIIVCDARIFHMYDVSFLIELSVRWKIGLCSFHFVNELLENIA